MKPMNCPGHVMLYKSELHSYRDLPLRYFEFGTVYRHEMSGVVHGLLRARGFTQDDAHVFCTRDQVVDEVVAILDLVDHIMSTFGFQYEAEISTRPEKSIGTDDMWEHATNALKEACARHGLAYDINEGDGAFYGPKIDIKVKDAIGRTWQCSTVQVDFNMPERFGLTYRTEDNTEERPWMLHRAIFGSIERFLGILIEHYAGALPLWLAPVQVVVLPIADRHKDAAADLAKKAQGGRRSRGGVRPERAHAREDRQGAEPEDPVHGGHGRQGDRGGHRVGPRPSRGRPGLLAGRAAGREDSRSCAVEPRCSRNRK